MASPPRWGNVSDDAASVNGKEKKETIGKSGKETKIKKCLVEKRSTGKGDGTVKERGVCAL